MFDIMRHAGAAAGSFSIYVKIKIPIPARLMCAAAVGMYF